MPNDRAPLTIEECGDAVTVRERFEDIVDRHFFSENRFAVRSAIDALEYELLRPLLNRIRSLEQPVQEFVESPAPDHDSDECAFCRRRIPFPAFDQHVRRCREKQGEMCAQSPAAPVNNFDVLARMSERNRKVQLAPLSNVTRAKAVKRGSEINIGASGNVIAGILNGKFVGGLILADRAEFESVKAELERERAERGGRGPDGSL